MKKQIQAELISIAHKILRAGEEVPVTQLQENARVLYEKLTLLNFAEKHFSEPQPTIGKVYEVLDLETIEIPEETTTSSIITPVHENNDSPVEVKEIKEPVVETPTVDTFEPIQPQDEVVKEEEKIPEIVIEEVNARVIEKDIFIPREETPAVPAPELVFEKNDIQDIANDAPELITFEKVNQSQQPKGISLNDRLKKTINIGLNDRLAFIKHLFLGSSADYNRVLSQLNTLNSLAEAEEFLRTLVKPDYNFWEGKEEYEERFMKIITNKFD